MLLTQNMISATCIRLFFQNPHLAEGILLFPNGTRNCSATTHILPEAFITVTFAGEIHQIAATFANLANGIRSCSPKTLIVLGTFDDLRRNTTI